MSAAATRISGRNQDVGSRAFDCRSFCTENMPVKVGILSERKNAFEPRILCEAKAHNKRMLIVEPALNSQHNSRYQATVTKG